jgi:dethiobiotin synthetase
MGATFITSTGTDIGKTFVARGLIRQLRQDRRAVDAIKPVVSGFTPSGAAASDPGLLLAALGRAPTMSEIERIAPWRFVAPLSPDIAARKEERSIPFDALVDFCRDAIDAADEVLLIEGVGGIMVPLDERHTVLDWIAALAVPVIVVAGNYLGTISHTLTTLAVLANQKVAVRGVVVSDTTRTASLQENVGAIARFSDRVLVLPLPRLARHHEDHPTFVQLAARL